ncbi:MAG: hypothetical protein ACE5IL_11245 [Myxococcota bacterium]
MNASVPDPGGAVAESAGSPRVLRFDDLERYRLLRNGNDLYRVPLDGHWAVLKVYFGSRSTASCALKTAGNWIVAGQTSVMPRARRRQELRCLRLWRSAGVRVFGTYDQVRVEGLPEGGYTLFEYVRRRASSSTSAIARSPSRSASLPGAVSFRSGIVATGSRSRSASPGWCTRTATSST